ncbi:MAG: peptidylprolyl isomerase, partial [Planctomycetota bacterium]
WSKMRGNKNKSFAQEEHRREIARIREETERLKLEVGPAAIEAFREAPEADRNVVMTVISNLNSALNPGDSETSKFNPALALEITRLLSDNGVDQPQVSFAGFRAAYAIHDFEYAAAMLEKLATTDARLNDSVPAQLESTRAKWERELQLRTAEELADDLPMVRFETTVGDFTAVLYENEAPETVGNFIHLVEEEFYDGLSFYVVRPGMMIQSGCPLGNGKGHAGYTIACECEGDDIRHHFAGTLSMFNGGPDTGGSRFFICQQPNEQLDGRYTVFGRIVDNPEVIYDFSAINKTGVIPDPWEPATIEKVTVLRKRSHEYVPNRVAVLAPVDPRVTQNGRQPEPARTVPPLEDPRLTIPVGEPPESSGSSGESSGGGEESGDGNAGGESSEEPEPEAAASGNGNDSAG